MKEFTIEEKAQRYDEAIERAWYWEKNPTVWSSDDICQKLFPELRESEWSEDERIRQEIIDYLSTVDDKELIPCESWIAWIEKIGKNTINNVKSNLLTVERAKGISPFMKSGFENKDKVEPKFKVGDTIMDKDFDEYGYGIIKDIKDGRYIFTDGSCINIDEQNGWQLIKTPANIEQKPAETEKGVKRNDREIPFSEKEPYEGLTDFERTLADICIGWIGQELGWKQYIKDNADALLKIAIKKFNSVQDAIFEKKPADKVIEDEKSLLEKFKQAVCDCAWGKVTCKTEGETQEEYAERWAEQLLSIVRDWADDYIDSREDSIKRRAYDKGKNDTINEQKPAWSKEDEANLNEALSYIKDDALKEFIKSLRPQRNVGYNPYKAVVESITKMVEKYESIISNKVDAVDFLNEVRAKCNEAKQYDVKYPQLQWKPSEEQLYYLSWITNIKLCDSVVEQEASKHLNKLYEQLKQL